MLSILLILTCGAVAGALSGALAARWLIRRHQPNGCRPAAPADPFISAELDQAAVRWAAANGQPEAAAGLMADKLHLLYALGRRRRP